MEISEITLLLKKKDFSIKDTGISYRIINNWSEKGLLSHLRVAEGKWHRLTFMELVEVHIYKELSKIGFSIEKLKKVKNAFYVDYGIKFLIDKNPDVFFKLNSLNQTIALALNGENICLVINSSADSVNFLGGLHIAEIFAGRSPLANETYGIGHSLIVINIHSILEKLGLKIEISNEKIGILLDELLEEETQDNGLLHIIREKGFGKIKKVRKISNRKIDKGESLNKIARKPNQKITLYSNNHGDLTANIEEDLKIS